MKNSLAAALATGCLLFGVGMGVGFAAKEKSPGIDLMRGKPAKEAGRGPCVLPLR